MSRFLPIKPSIDWRDLYHPRIYPIAALAVIAIAIGLLYSVGLTGNLRWVKLGIGLALVSAILFSRTSIGLGAFLIACVFPAQIVIGPTNFVLAVLLFVFWLARGRLGSSERPRRTPCDWPLVLLTVAYAISWVNVTRNPFTITQAWYYSQNHIGSLMIFYMTAAAIRERRDITILFGALFGLAAILYIGAVVEVTTGFTVTGLGNIGAAGYRIGGDRVRAAGMLGSHDMMADFCSMMLPAHAYFVYRARSSFGRYGHALLAVGAVVVLLMTSNRGGIVGMGAGILYALWILRHQLTWMTVGIFSSFGLGLILALDTVLSGAGRTLSVFRRLATTKFYGLLPETRVGVWDHFKARVSEHFWLGEGPFYRLARRDPSEYVFWPHNAFGYYWVTVGILGMVSFIAFCWQLLSISWRERARRLGESYPREILLVLHVMIVVFVVSQQRTDFQRGHVFTYIVFLLFGLTVGVWRLVREEREQREPAVAEAGQSRQRNR